MSPYRGNVYATIYPDVWKLNDINDDGYADKREVFFQGFGVHAAFDGHDLHGLTVGPDGKLYFQSATTASRFVRLRVDCCITRTPAVCCAVTGTAAASRCLPPAAQRRN